MITNNGGSGSGGGSDVTPAQIRDKLESLPQGSRLSAHFIDDIINDITIDELRGDSAYSAFNPVVNYSKDDKVTHNNRNYIALEGGVGEWDAAKWEELSVANNAKPETIKKALERLAGDERLNVESIKGISEIILELRGEDAPDPFNENNAYSKYDKVFNNGFDWVANKDIAANTEFSSNNFDKASTISNTEAFIMLKDESVDQTDLISTHAGYEQSIVSNFNPQTEYIFDPENMTYVHYGPSGRDYMLIATPPVGTLPIDLEYWIDLSNAGVSNPFQVKRELEFLTGNNRLDSSAIKNLPDGGITDAPSDDKLYARENGAWSEVHEGLSDAPSDNKLYARENGNWSEVHEGLSDAPSDDRLYARENGNWSAVPEGLSDAPSNGQLYGRKDGTWIQVDEDGIHDAPSDDKTYGRKNGNWTEIEEQSYNHLRFSLDISMGVVQKRFGNYDGDISISEEEPGFSTVSLGTVLLPSNAPIIATVNTIGVNQKYGIRAGVGGLGNISIHIWDEATGNPIDAACTIDIMW